MAHELLPPDPNDYDWNVVDVYVCQNCQRQTMTGLCGCSEPNPEFDGRNWYGTPRREAA